MKTRRLRQVLECYWEPHSYATTPLVREGHQNLALFFDGPMGLRRGIAQTVGQAMRNIHEDWPVGYYEPPRFFVGYYRCKSRKGAQLAIKRWVEKGEKPKNNFTEDT